MVPCPARQALTRALALWMPRERGKAFVGVPWVVFQDRNRQRTFGQFADFPVVVEEPVLKALSQDKVQLRLVEQMIDVPKISSKDQILQGTRNRVLKIVPKIDRFSGQSFAVRQESDSPGSADDKTVGGCAQDRVSRQNPAMLSVSVTGCRTTT